MIRMVLMFPDAEVETDLPAVPRIGEAVSWNGETHNIVMWRVVDVEYGAHPLGTVALDGGPPHSIVVCLDPDDGTGQT